MSFVYTNTAALQTFLSRTSNIGLIGENITFDKTHKLQYMETKHKKYFSPFRFWKNETHFNTGMLIYRFITDNEYCDVN